ncbi:hypothetical protein HK097_004274 [Rhizophlyctis rosea]|uniref:Uncharacterized protein n=1 Tax=Rhizophlyctis rosea TaxID=64517 RepID=A0AAD5X060_9FUNG|nr:hypothetical protein HK097_004274 [Rhizophlyctis rosea]
MPDWVDKWDDLGRWKGQSLEIEGLVDTAQAVPDLARDPGWDEFEAAEREYTWKAKKNSSRTRVRERKEEGPDPEKVAERKRRYREARDVATDLARRRGEAVSGIEYEMKTTLPPEAPPPCDNKEKDPNWVPPPDGGDGGEEGAEGAE